MNELFSIPAILVYSILFGSMMKLADCFNEHGFKWFKFDAIVFGILFGIFGGLLTLSDPALTNLYLALLLVNILRFRVDKLNHGIAANIIFLSFLFVANNFNWTHFLYLFVPFAFFGLLMDVIIPKTSSLHFLEKIFETRFYYFIVTFLFSFYTDNWLVFVSMTLFQLSYNLTSKYAKRSKHYINIK